MLVSYSDTDSEDDIHTEGPYSAPIALRLPSVPVSVVDMFQNNVASERTSLSNGSRIRSFPHERGNWATHVYVPVESTAGLLEFAGHLAQVLSWTPTDDLHISLSRTFSIPFHQIDPLSAALRASLSSIKRFDICVTHQLRPYANDEKTATFLALEVGDPGGHLSSLVETVNTCLASFGLPCFYRQPSWHLSLLRTTGDESERIRDRLPEVQAHFGRCCAMSDVDGGCADLGSYASVVHVNKVAWKCGNRQFVVGFS